jgi:hypothetical protein
LMYAAASRSLLPDLRRRWSSLSSMSGTLAPLPSPAVRCCREHYRSSQDPARRCL